jgi:MYXO-CTERM domain-containing protein
MRLAPLIVSGMLLTASAFAQTTTNPNPNPDAYTQNPYTYNRPVVVKTGYGGWGLLGLFGLCGLLGRRRRETIVRGRDEYVTDQRRRVA